jgi:TolA-binding protein
MHRDAVLLPQLENVMKTLFVVMLISALLVGCGSSAQEKKANSPECLAAKNQAAERKANSELLDAEIRAKNDVTRQQIENMRLEDQIAQLEGRPIKNRKAEALLESAIRANEIGLKYAPDSTAIDKELIRLACEIPQGKPTN